VDVKKRVGVITHKNVFVPRHDVLFLGLMYYLGGGAICVVLFYWFIETWSTKNAHPHALLILTA
jgi:hypothetical protein